MQRAAQLVHAPRFHVAFIAAFRGGHGVVPDADGVEAVHVHGDAELGGVQEGMPHVEGEGFIKEGPVHGVPLTSDFTSALISRRSSDTASIVASVLARRRSRRVVNMPSCRACVFSRLDRRSSIRPM